MKDSGLAVRTAYYQALNGNVEVDGVNVPVYDGAPSGADYPYILLSTQDSTEGKGLKDDDCFNLDETILLDIVTGFPSNTGGKRQHDLIANEILQLIHPKITIDSKEVRTTLVNGTTLEEISGDRKIFRKLLRFRHNIFQ
jgi:hypothetical protein